MPATAIRARRNSRHAELLKKKAIKKAAAIKIIATARGFIVRKEQQSILEARRFGGSDLLARGLAPPKPSQRPPAPPPPPPPPPPPSQPPAFAYNRAIHAGKWCNRTDIMKGARRKSKRGLWGIQTGIRGDPKFEFRESEELRRWRMWKHQPGREAGYGFVLACLEDKERRRKEGLTKPTIKDTSECPSAYYCHLPPVEELK